MTSSINGSAVIDISIAEQLLRFRSNELQVVYPVSTALNGPGQSEGSGCTPIGRHYIRAKIGADLPKNAVFIGRRWTQEIYSESLAKKFPKRDWILSRILWLCGNEAGFNRLGTVDSMRRYIYIHGTPDSEPMGVPKSHGCIRMRNQDVMELFENVRFACPVNILAGPFV